MANIGGAGPQSGFSLLEVMVAAAVLGIGLAGVAALTLDGLTQSSESRQRTAAALLAAELGARLRLAAPCPVLAECPLPGEWLQRVSVDLPDGDAVLCRDGTPDDGRAGAAACDGSGAPVLKLFWRGPQRPERLVLGIAR